MPVNKIAYTSSVIPALSATFIYREIFELERRGYRIYLYSHHRPEPDSLSAESLPLSRQTYYLLPARVKDLLAAHAYYALRKPRRYLRALWKMIKPADHRLRSLMHFGEGAILARRLERDQITHVHAHYASQPTSVARVVYLLTNIPYSFSAHAHDIWYDRLMLREKLDETVFAACCSEFGRTHLASQGRAATAQKIHLVYHGIDVKQFVPPEASRRDDLILAVGRLDEMKGFHHLIEACQYLRNQGVRFECRIVGEGEERSRLSALIADLELRDHVHLVGAVTQEKILAHYHEAAIFCVPCIESADGRHDGIPNVFLEAMATALPVVTTPISGIPELIVNGSDGFLVPPADARALAETLSDLLNDSHLRSAVGAAARAKVSTQFDNRQTIEPLIELLSRNAGLESATGGSN